MNNLLLDTHMQILRVSINSDTSYRRQWEIIRQENLSHASRMKCLAKKNTKDIAKNKLVRGCRDQKTESKFIAWHCVSHSTGHVKGPPTWDSPALTMHVLSFDYSLLRF